MHNSCAVGELFWPIFAQTEEKTAFLGPKLGKEKNKKKRCGLVTSFA